MPNTVRGKKEGETSIKIPKGLAESVDRLVNNEGSGLGLGYRSRQEFCIDSIRRLVTYYVELQEKCKT